MNYSVESVGVPPTGTGPKCTLAVKLQDWTPRCTYTSFYMTWCYDVGAYRAQWQESLCLAEAILGLMAGKLLIGRDFAT